MSERPPMSIEQQADLVDYLVDRATRAPEGTRATEAWLHLTTDEVEDLRATGQRLRRMAPHEDAIRDIVVGR